MPNLKDLCKKINIRYPLLFDEPMSGHTSFKIGGPADVFAKPANKPECLQLVTFCRQNKVPFFVLGAGSNILVSDNGIEGMVIDLGLLTSIEVSGSVITARSGALVSDVCERAFEHSLTGMEFIYSMPGTVGGAIWMNARCYGTSVSDVLVSVDYLGDDLEMHEMHVNPNDFGYKHSPFQRMQTIILGGNFLLGKGDQNVIRKEMDLKKADREKKGHFLAPCAGSVFKNNRELGKSTGEILDSLGFLGYTIGGARVSPLHANIIINNNNARASDVYKLILFIEKTVQNKLGFTLDREVILAGRW